MRLNKKGLNVHGLKGTYALTVDDVRRDAKKKGRSVKDAIHRAKKSGRLANRVVKEVDHLFKRTKKKDGDYDDWCDDFAEDIHKMHEDDFEDFCFDYERIHGKEDAMPKRSKCLHCMDPNCDGPLEEDYDLPLDPALNVD